MKERFAWGASLGAIAGYALAVLTSLPIRLIYYPHSDSWGTLDVPGQPVIRWYGSMVTAGLGALVGMALMWPLRIRVRWSPVWIVALAVLLYLSVRESHWFAR